MLMHAQQLTSIKQAFHCQLDIIYQGIEGSTRSPKTRIALILTVVIATAIHVVNSTPKANQTRGPLDITISGNKFYRNGKEIFFNGVNMPWQKHSDFTLDYLGRDFDYNYWVTQFQRFKDNHINLVRVWIHCAGNYSPSLNGGGMVTGASSKFWEDMDNLVKIATDFQIYIMPTIWSFGMTRSDSGWSRYYAPYRQIINDVNKTRWYTEYFLIPFVQRYNDRPFVMGYDICNEPEHMWRDDNTGKLNQNNVLRFVAYCAAAIHEHSSKPVTVGSMWIIYNSDRYQGWDTGAGNCYKDSKLQSLYNNPKAYLDFWSPHWYQWQSTSGPFNTSIGYWLDNGDRPVLIGEAYGGNVNSGTQGNCCNYQVTMANFYKNSYLNGYRGVCGWINPHENDGYGTFAGVASGTNDFYANYPQLVNP